MHEMGWRGAPGLCYNEKNGKWGMAMAVTLQQLAEACGVSRGTVDRALHDKEGVRPEVAARIKEKAREMGYIPARACPVAAARPVRIGVVLHSASSVFVQLLAERFRTAPLEEMLPVETVVRTLEGVNVAHQLALIEELVEIERIDGLALMPLASALICSKINELSETRGIPVVTLNTDIVDSCRLAYVGPDNVASGRAAAALMGLTVGGQGQILPILGERNGHYADSQRLSGFMAEMGAQYPQVQVLPPACCFLDQSFAERITLRELAANERLAGVYLSSVGRAGVYRALQATGAAGRVHVVVHDLTPDNLDMVRAGVVDFAIGQDLKTQGTLPLRLLYQYLARRKSPDQRVYTTNIEIKFRCNLAPECGA